MGGIGDLIKKHPELIGALVIGVIILAYFNSRNASSSPASGGDVSFTGGGVAAVPVDPNAAAIQEAQISANSANLSTVSQLYLGLQQTAAAQDVENNQTSAALSSAMAQTEAQRVVGLAAIDSQTQVAQGQTAAQIQEANIGATEQLNAANITSQMAANAEAANIQTAQINAATAANQASTALAASQSQDKTSFWESLFRDSGGVLAAIFAA
jgi:hypothetical protein